MGNSSSHPVEETHLGSRYCIPFASSPPSSPVDNLSTIYHDASSVHGNDNESVAEEEEEEVERAVANEEEEEEEYAHPGPHDNSDHSSDFESAVANHDSTPETYQWNDDVPIPSPTTQDDPSRDDESEQEEDEQLEDNFFENNDEQEQHSEAHHNANDNHEDGNTTFASAESATFGTVEENSTLVHSPATVKRMDSASTKSSTLDPRRLEVGEENSANEFFAAETLRIGEFGLEEFGTAFASAVIQHLESASTHSSTLEPRGLEDDNSASLSFSTDPRHIGEDGEETSVPPKWSPASTLSDHPTTCDTQEEETDLLIGPLEATPQEDLQEEQPSSNSVRSTASLPVASKKHPKAARPQKNHEPFQEKHPRALMEQSQDGPQCSSKKRQLDDEEWEDVRSTSVGKAKCSKPRKYRKRSKLSQRIIFDDSDEEDVESYKIPKAKDSSSRRANNKKNAQGQRKKPKKKYSYLLDEYPEYMDIAFEIGHPLIMPPKRQEL